MLQSDLPRAGRIAALALLCVSAAALTARAADAFDPMTRLARIQSCHRRSNISSPPMHSPRLSAGNRASADRRAGTEGRGVRAPAFSIRARSMFCPTATLVVESRRPTCSRSTGRRTSSWAWSSLGDLRRRYRREQPHHAVARHQRRRQAGARERLPRSLEFAVRCGAGRLDLYVANTDAIVRYPYKEATPDHRPRRRR